jgi:hypothetical protein
LLQKGHDVVAAPRRATALSSALRLVMTILKEPVQCLSNLRLYRSARYRLICSKATGHCHFEPQKAGAAVAGVPTAAHADGFG